MAQYRGNISMFHGVLYAWYVRDVHQGRIRFCALILDFDEK